MLTKIIFQFLFDQENFYSSFQTHFKAHLVSETFTDSPWNSSLFCFSQAINFQLLENRVYAIFILYFLYIAQLESIFSKYIFLK